MTSTDVTDDAVDPTRFTYDAMLAWAKEQRRTQPVHFDERQQFWEVFDYATISQVLSDPGTFSSDFSGLTPTQEDFEAFRKGMFVTMDPPRHRKLRSMVSQAFTPRMVTELGPRIQAITDQLLDDLDGAERFDLMEDLAFPLPVIVIAELLGIPPEDRVIFRRWANVLFEDDQMGADVVPEEIEKALNNIAPTIREMNNYLLAHIDRCRRTPGDDLTSKLVNVEVNGERLDDEEILGFTALLLVAGHITTTAALGNSMLSLDENPDAFATLRADPAGLPTAIEEVLRYRTPFARVGRRTTTAVELGGHAIGPDQIVMLYLASGNRDEAQFVDPDRFDVARKPNPHLTFGHGIHFCIGAPLARLETRIALTTLMRRYREIAIASDVPTEFQNPWIIVGARQLPLDVRTA